MQLTEATEDDIDVLVELWYSLASDMEQYSEYNTLSYGDVSEVPEAGFRNHLESEDITEYLLEEDGDTIGLLTTRVGEHPSREYTKYTNIVNLLVEEQYRNLGYGADAVSKVKELARANGCDHLKVSCEWANDGARRFYAENGFEKKQVSFVQELEE